MTERSRLDELKDVLGGCARALSHEAEVELAYTAEAPSQSGVHLKVPMPARDLPPEQVAQARGSADGFALRLRYHDSNRHFAEAPTEPLARACFDALEQVRIEALGTRQMAGVGENLTAALAQRLRSDPIARAETRDDVPIASALALIAREKLTGQSAPEVAQNGVEMLREWIEDEGGLILKH